MIYLDWFSYFETFCEAHGPPVDVNGRLLFRDGWAYDRLHHEGPEYPAPTEPILLQRLRVEYWTARRAVVAKKFHELKHDAEQLRLMSLQRSVPLFQAVQLADDEGKPYIRREQLNVDALSMELLELSSDLAECDRELANVQAIHN